MKSGPVSEYQLNNQLVSRWCWLVSQTHRLTLWVQCCQNHTALKQSDNLRHQPGRGLHQSALLCTVVLCNGAPRNIIRKKRGGLGLAGWLGEVFCVGGRGDGRERRRVGGLRGGLNFVNGVFLRASHSALKAKPPGWGLWSAGIRHAQSVPLLKSPSESYLFEQPFLNLFLYQLVGCDLAKCFGNRRQRWMVKRRRFPLALFSAPSPISTHTHTLTLTISPPVPSPSI